MDLSHQEHADTVMLGTSGLGHKLSCGFYFVLCYFSTFGTEFRMSSQSCIFCYYHCYLIHVFGAGSHYAAWTPSDPPVSALPSAGITGIHHYVQLNTPGCRAGMPCGTGNIVIF